MNTTELEARIAEIQQELSVVKEVSSSKPNILDILWGLSFLAAILLIIIILFLILREEEDFTVKNIISVLSYNLRPSSIKEKIASLSHKKKRTFLVVTIVCVVLIAASVTAKILIDNYTKPRWVTDTFTARDSDSDKLEEYTGAYAFKIEKKLGGEEFFTTSITGAVILEGKEYRAREAIDIGDMWLVLLVDLNDDAYFPPTKAYLYIMEDFTDIMVEYKD